MVTYRAEHLLQLIGGPNPVFEECFIPLVEPSRCLIQLRVSQSEDWHFLWFELTLESGQFHTEPPGTADIGISAASENANRPLERPLHTKTSLLLHHHSLAAAPL